MVNIQKETKVIYRLKLEVEDYQLLTSDFGNKIIILNPEQLLSLKETIDKALEN